MNKLVVMNRISLDGYFTDENNPSRPEWSIEDPELDKWMMTDHDFMKPNAYLFGKTTYRQFENVWTKVNENSNVSNEVIQMAKSLNKMKKFVISKSLKNLTWENSFLLNKDIIEDVKKIKKENNGDILIFGSGSIIQQLTSANLIDEYLLIVTPIILGKGKLLFKDVNKTKLDLIESVQFKSGNILLHYKTMNL